MFARSISYPGNPSTLDDGIAFVRDEVMPAITQMSGCVGMSLVIDRDSGRAIATSSWESIDQMRGSFDQLASMRERGAEILGGAPAVDEWEVGLMHRDHRTADGACCRISWARASDIDATVDTFRSTVLPRMEETDGFCSASLLLDRDGGRTCGTFTFDSRATLDATRERAAEMRAKVTEAIGLEFTDVGEFDLAMAHLRLPELV